MIDKTFFFRQADATIYRGKMTATQQDGMDAILNEWIANYAQSDERWLAYMLGTTFHETARQMQPIDEFGKGKGLPYGSRLKMAKDKNGRRIPYTDTDQLYYGRGFVQLTWYENYDRAGKALGLDLLRNPELVKDIANATKIMFLGMTQGWFTGVGLKKFFNATTADWKNARKIINGLDKAEEIAKYARDFHACLGSNA
jgi:hypothetical protein